MDGFWIDWELDGGIMPTNNAINLTAQGTVYYNGTGTFSGIDGSTSGRVLTSNGTGVAPSFQAAPSGSGITGFVATGQAGAPPADSTTYYLNQSGVLTASTTSTIATTFFAVSSVTITKVYGIAKVSATLGSAENCTVFIRVNNTTNTNITTTLQLNSAENAFNNSGLSISLNAGDFFVFGFTGPAWATNPTGVLISLGFSS